MIQDDIKKSLEIKLNKREAELERMEKLLMDLHKQIDSLKSDKQAADEEAKSNFKSIVKLDKEMEVHRHETRFLREKYEEQVERLEKEVQTKHMGLWKKDLTI